MKGERFSRFDEGFIEMCATHLFKFPFLGNASLLYMPLIVEAPWPRVFSLVMGLLCLMQNNPKFNWKRVKKEES